VRAITEYPGALIVGERDLSNVDINGKSLFANKFSNFWFHLQTGRKLRDTQTGYRAYPLDKLHGLSLLTSRYEAELELLVFAAWHGVKIHSMPIRVFYPSQAERVSHFKPALDFTRISILNTILCVGAVVYGLPVRLWQSIALRKLFAREFRVFTRLTDGSQRDAALTLKRLACGLYGAVYFIFWTLLIFTPITFVFSLGNKSEFSKLRFHKMLCWMARFFTVRFPNATTTIHNPEKETFNRPSLIICNHQSHLDLPLLMTLYPKLIFLTNDWVWNNPYYGRIIHAAEFLPVSSGLDVIMPQLCNLKERGYSIVIFPEGTRSDDCSILRFHQGAFHIARELELDILPMTIHGIGHYLPKHDILFREGQITLSILPRISACSLVEIPTLRQASMFRKMIRAEYEAIADRVETANYYIPLVRLKYAYRGWAVVAQCKRDLARVGTIAAFADKRNMYHRVRFIGSGIGTLPLLFALANPATAVVGYESSVEEFDTARSTPSLPDNLEFRHAVWHHEFEDDSDFDLTVWL
jgi:1-acyl-sn-glycerol-3-phosphate acyltransferase